MTRGASVKSSIVTCNAIAFRCPVARTISIGSTNCPDTDSALGISVSIRQKLRRFGFVAHSYSNMTSPGTTRIFS
jgi:hypothetical protein